MFGIRDPGETRRMMEGESLEGPFVSVIVPAHNEELRIGPTLEKLTSYFASRPFRWEVIVIDNGSEDATAQIVERWASTTPQVRLESIPDPGKGGAVRHGMLRATGANRFMCDADMSMPVEFLDDFIEQMEAGYDVVLGSRQVRGARRFGESAARHMMGRGFNWVVRVAVVRGILDTQCGFKMFRGEAADDIFERQRITGWAFDVEVLSIARQRGMSLLEMPIDWRNDPASKINPLADSFRMLRDTCVVWWRAVTGAYR